MIIEGELKDYIVIPIDDLILLSDDLRTMNSLLYNPNYSNEENKLINRTKINFINDLIEKYSN